MDSADNIKTLVWLASIQRKNPDYALSIFNDAIEHTIATLNCSMEAFNEAIETFPPQNKEQTEIFNCFYSYIKSVRDSL